MVPGAPQARVPTEKGARQVTQPFAYKRGPYPQRRRAKPNASPEADFQLAVIEYLRFALPDNYRFRAGLEGVRLSINQATRAKALGARKGWPDLMLFNRETRGIRWIELKAPKGRLTPEQTEIAAELGDHLAVCRTLEEVEAALIRWRVAVRAPLAKANRYGGGQP